MPSNLGGGQGDPRQEHVLLASCPGFPVVHEHAPQLPEVHDLEPYAVGVFEERRVVIRTVLGIVARFRDLHAGRPQLPGSAVYRGLVYHPEAEVVQTGGVRVVVWGAIPRRPQRVDEMAVVVEEVGIAADGAVAFAETQDPHHAVVERFGSAHIAHGYVDVVYTYRLDTQALTG